MELAATLEPLKPTEQLVPLNTPIKTRKKRAPKHDFKDGKGRVFAHKHDNGKGWVANTATVEDHVYVAPRAEVYDYATIRGSCRIEKAAKVYGHANVSGAVIITNSARVSGQAVVQDSTKIYNAAVVSGRAFVGGDSQIWGLCDINGNVYILSSCLFGQVTASGHTTIVRSNLNGPITVIGSASLTHATVAGRVWFGNFAQVAHSTIDNSSNQGVTTVRDFAVVLDNSRIRVPIEIKDHAVIVRSTLSNFRPRTEQAPLVIDQNLILSQWDCHALENFETLLNAARLPRNQPIAAPVISRPGAVSITTPRMPIGDESSRRVMRLQGVTS
jgi:NDP-sugar pyrophosphorylase family protein